MKYLNGQEPGGKNGEAFLIKKKIKKPSLCSIKKEKEADLQKQPHEAAIITVGASERSEQGLHQNNKQFSKMTSYKAFGCV